MVQKVYLQFVWLIRICSIPKCWNNSNYTKQDDAAQAATLWSPAFVKHLTWNLNVWSKTKRCLLLLEDAYCEGAFLNKRSITLSVSWYPFSLFHKHSSQQDEQACFLSRSFELGWRWAAGRRPGREGIKSWRRNWMKGKSTSCVCVVLWCDNNWTKTTSKLFSHTLFNYAQVKCWTSNSSR